MVNESGWAIVPLQEVLDFREGPGIMARDFRKQGVPLIRLTGLRQGGSLLDGCNFLDPDIVDRRWAQFRVRPGDVLLSTSASLGQVAVVGESGAGAVPYTGIIRFRSRDDRLLPAFVQYVLRAPHFVRQIEAMGVGSVLRHFGPAHLRQMTVAVPPAATQRDIAAVLGAIDGEIECSQRIADIAFHLALAHGWSVFQAEAGDIVSLGDLVDVTKGVSYSRSDLREGEDRLVNLKCVGRDGSFRADGLKPYCGDFRAEQVVQANDIIVAQTDLTQRADVIGRPIRVPRLESSGRLIASLDLAIVRPRPPLTQEALLALLSTQAFRDHATSYSNGTTVLHMSSRAVPEFRFPLTHPAAIERLSSVMGPLLALSDAALLRTTIASRLRRDLSPALLSGQLSVGGSDTIAEAM